MYLSLYLCLYSHLHLRLLPFLPLFSFFSFKIFSRSYFVLRFVYLFYGNATGGSMGHIRDEL